MEPVAQYLKRALELERLADSESNPALKKKLQELTQEYYKLAKEKEREAGKRRPDR